MTISVTHAAVATLPDEPGAEINKDEWNDEHVVTGAVPDTRTVNGHALSSDVTVSASDVGAVPTSRTVNGHVLSGDVTITASDVGAPSGSGTCSGTNTGDQTISDATISTSDITTNNASTSKHGFLKKLDNDASHFMDGQGNWSTPAGGGTVTTTGSPASGNLAKFSGGTSVTNGDLTGAVTTSGGLVTTLASGLSPDFAAISLNSQLLQCFTVVLANVSGTIQHAIRAMIGDGTTPSGYVSKVSGASVTLTTSPTVDASHDFTTGAGINGASIVLNTPAQSASVFFGFAIEEYYDGNVKRAKVYPSFVSRNVNGTTRTRLELKLTDDMTGADWTINTTNLPNGKSIALRFFGFLA